MKLETCDPVFVPASELAACGHLGQLRGKHNRPAPPLRASTTCERAEWSRCQHAQCLVGWQRAFRAYGPRQPTTLPGPLWIKTSSLEAPRPAAGVVAEAPALSRPRASWLVCRDIDGGERSSPAQSPPWHRRTPNGLAYSRAAWIVPQQSGVVVVCVQRHGPSSARCSPRANHPSDVGIIPLTIRSTRKYGKKRLASASTTASAPTG